MNGSIKDIFHTNIQLLDCIDKSVYHFRIQNYDRALRGATTVINQLSTLVGLLSTNSNYFNEEYSIVDMNSIMSMLENLLSAQENQDYILLADLYEMQLTPFLLNLQDLIMTKEELVFDEDSYNNTIKAIIESNAPYLSKLQKLSHPTDRLDEGYRIEYTSSGLLTLAIENAGKCYYMHSNNKVINESFILANSWYSNEKNNYIIYGLGLGYHVNELFMLDKSINIEVYESDIKVIQLALAFSNTDFFWKDHPNIKFYYDPDFIRFSDSIVKIDDNTEICIHNPSLRNIKNSEIKEKLENYFLQYSSIKNQLPLLKENFKENILNYDGLIDELRERFLGKDLYIIAAGPSLDKNFFNLKNLNEDAIILATGTVFRKLITAGIRPDYVIVTDANERVYAQVSRLEKEDVPMLYLSTAYKGFAKNYQGKKYMICQEGFPEAEGYAFEKGTNLYRTGGSVSTTALDVGISLGCKRIIFLGLDLAYTDNFVHAQNTSRRELSSTDNLRQVEDIKGNMIYTSKSLDMYRQWIEKRIKDVKGIEFIDATEGGAKIKGMRVANMKADGQPT